MQHHDTAALVAAILNAGYMVRFYARPVQREQRREAILALGLAVREAFNASEDFETLLAAVADALRPRDERPF